ncbi:glycoside hydrolase family 128 protein [Hydnomerulius pinastri MD-312]|nr:glycoside hydrolase family 128 protein [Hydnomerulius pinastri MD-312]
MAHQTQWKMRQEYIPTFFLFHGLLAVLLLPFICTGIATRTQIDPVPRAVTNTSKAGLAWPNGNYVNVDQFLSTGKVSWYYTWSSSPIYTDIEFVPMLWGSDQVDSFASINDTISHYHVSAVLGMNEPQQSAQSNLTPSEGAQLWKSYLEPLKAQGVRLGSPAPSSAPSGKTWLLDFLTECQGGCTMDFIALHWYDVNATTFESYLKDFHDTFQRPLWVTEWACQNYNNADAQFSYEDIVQFVNQTQGFMDNTDYVERYAWFGAMENLQGVNPDDALMDKSGTINALGKQYIGSTSGSRRRYARLPWLWVSVVVPLLCILSR